jgi:hypothetical protein
MTITLSDEVRTIAESKAKAAGFADVAEFVEHAIETYDDPLPDPPAGTSYVVNSMDELEQKLDAALEDTAPSVPMTPEFWNKLLKLVEERAAERRRTVG